MNQQDFLSVTSTRPSTPLSAASTSGGVRPRAASQAGALIVNADDWGRNRITTDRTLESVIRGSVSSVSAMVFMEDSERAATLAWEASVDAGLHLNLTTAFSSPESPAELARHQEKVARFLTRHRMSKVFFHPGLARSFEYVVAAQIDEFRRLYGGDPARIDGHHHMHLCANVLLAGLLPAGTIARRNFTFQPGEKGFVNRYYRGLIDKRLARRHQLVDYLFSLPPFEPPARLQQIFLLARRAVVELETHPANTQEYRFLTSGQLHTCAGDLEIAPRFTMPERAFC